MSFQISVSTKILPSVAVVGFVINLLHGVSIPQKRLMMPTSRRS